MNIPAIAKSLAATAFGIADSVMTDAVLHITNLGSHTVDDYDPTTDTMVSGTTDYNVRGLMYQEQAQKLAVDSADLAMFMVQADDAALPVLPNNLNCYVVVGSVRWNATLTEYVPGDPVFIFRLRRT